MDRKRGEGRWEVKKMGGGREGIGKGGYEMTRFEICGPDTHRCLSHILAHFSLMTSCTINNYFQCIFINEKMSLSYT